MIKEKDYEMALTYFEQSFVAYKITKEFTFRKIILCLCALIYLKKLSKNEYLEAFKFLNNLNKEYWDRELYISLYNKENKLEDFNLDVI